MLRSIVVSLSLGIIFVLTLAPLKAQPVINKIESREARGGQETTLKLSPGQETTLILRGKGFLKIKRVEIVRIGEMDISVVRDAVKSDEVIEVTIRIPRHARVGSTQEFAFRVSGDGLAEWLIPQPTNAPREIRSNPEPEEVAPPPSDPQPETVSLPQSLPTRATPQTSPRAAKVAIFLDGRPVTRGAEAIIKFDTTTVGSPVSERLVVHNPGQSTLRLQDPRVSHGFRLVGAFPESIVPGDSGFITIQVEAENDSSFSGMMLFSSNVPDQNPFALQLQATVLPIAPALPSPGWWVRMGVWIILLISIIVAVLFALKRKKTLKPSVQFRPSKDLGSPKIKQGQLIESRFELRLRPHFDHDQTRTQVDGLLIRDKERTAAKSKATLS